MSEVTGTAAREMLGLLLVKEKQRTHHEYACGKSAFRDLECSCPSGPSVFITPAHWRGGRAANDTGRSSLDDP